MPLELTPISSIPKIVANVQATFLSHRTQSLEFRKEQLRALQRMMSENEDEVTEAIKSDLNRSKDFEIPSIIATCEDYINNLEKLTEDRKAVGQKENDNCYTRLSPLISAAYKFLLEMNHVAFGLALEPLAGALAAGNVAIVKPSEVSENSARVMAQLFKKYMDPGVVSVINGGVEETTTLLQQRFDHIFYTGSTEVAKVVMAAAAKHLTPVTLELGGKCPVIITEHTDLADAAKKIAFWKTLNSGQVCVTADYILCPKHLQGELIQNVIGTWKHLFGEDAMASKKLPKIVTKRQHERLERLLEKAKTRNTIAFGGRTDEDTLLVEPTIVKDVSPDDEIMRDEIFGPILPIVTYDIFDHALDIIGKYELPLALYLFSDKKEQVDQLLRETRSGAFVVNDIGSHYMNETLPFGGVGHSGMGNYHGKFSIDTFSHHRAVLIRTQDGL
ncbi:Aldehyde dehydrogenase, dimeric NADP-preferring [Mortierella sp. AM989]|nr:Aldehyde dehydrogenase, dimeric NADP-preferring [Mortierella sp. AM989]